MLWNNQWTISQDAAGTQHHTSSQWASSITLDPASTTIGDDKADIDIGSDCSLKAVLTIITLSPGFQPQKTYFDILMPFLLLRLL